MPKTMRVGICGAGPAGLTLAAILSREAEAGAIELKVFERGVAQRDQGSGWDLSEAALEAHLALAEVLLVTEGPDAEIASALARAAALAPSDPRVPRVQASHLLRQGRSEEALEAMVQSRKLQEASVRGLTP